MITMSLALYDLYSHGVGVAHDLTGKESIKNQLRQGGVNWGIPITRLSFEWLLSILFDNLSSAFDE